MHFGWVCFAAIHASAVALLVVALDLFLVYSLFVAGKISGKHSFLLRVAFCCTTRLYIWVAEEMVI